MYKNLLPIGSVVLLEGANKRLMITGRVQAKVGDSKVYDYSGCFYPEGLVDPRSILFFDHSSISQLFFVGFQDQEELTFREDVLASLGELYVDADGRIAQKTPDE